MQRHMVITDRETLMITFERRVPEAERAARAARCIDDVIDAEESAKKIGRNAAIGAVALAATSAAAGNLIENLFTNHED
ncbi:MAG: hypothetical protein ACOYB2_19660 [Limnohabitans sp.]